MSRLQQGLQPKERQIHPDSSSIPDSALQPRVLISGYYGFDNLGDELILRVLTGALKARNVRVTVLSRAPAKTAEIYGVDAIGRTSLIDIIDALTRSNLFISGGGGLFQDATGPMSALYYGGLIHLARFFDVPVCLWGQGVGPLNGRLSRGIAASAFRRCEAITVRDEKSADLVAGLIGFRPEVTADPVWLLKSPLVRGARQDSGTSLFDTPKPSAPERKEPWRVGISLRQWPDLTPSRLQALAGLLQQLTGQMAGGRGVTYHLMPFQEKEDRPLLQALAGQLHSVHSHGSSDDSFGWDKRENPDPTGSERDLRDEAKDRRSAQAVTVEIVDPKDVLTSLGACDVLFGMRFHSLVLGLLANVPVYGLVYDPKVSALLAAFGLQGIHVANLESLDVAIVRAYLEDYPSIDLKPFEKRAQRNLEVLAHLLEIPAAELAF